MARWRSIKAVLQIGQKNDTSDNKPSSIRKKHPFQILIEQWTALEFGEDHLDNNPRVSGRRKALDLAF